MKELEWLVNLIQKDDTLLDCIVNPYFTPEMITFLTDKENEMRINPMALIADAVLPFNLLRHDVKLRVDNDLKKELMKSLRNV